MAAPINEEYSHNVRPKLDLIDKLQQVLERSSDRMDVHLPRIAVVGTQSSGKSTVLERLSGVQLPRGDDLCTRVPLVLSIKNEHEDNNEISYNKGNGKTFSKFIHKDVIACAVQKGTIELVGNGQSIANKPISLSISGRGLPDLTLVDLPGIVYTPKGDQPPNIYQEVKDLILDYIKPRETIVLCVFAGDADLQTSEALKLARQVDPDGRRTIGLITRVDRIEDPTLLIPKLVQEGKHSLGIKLGLIALRNQRHTNTCTPQKAIAEETKFFEDLKKVRQVPDGSWGIKSLAKRLCELQAQNLDACLPGVRDALAAKVRQAEDELENLQVPGTPLESFKLLRANIDELLRLMKNLLKTNYNDLQEKGVGKDAETDFHVFPRIEEVQQELQRQLLASAPKVFMKSTETEIRTQLQQVSGRHLPNFLSPEIFSNLMTRWFRPYKQLISDASSSAIECVEDVVEKSAKLVTRKEFFEFVRKAIQSALEAQFERLDTDTKSILEKESAVVHTQNDYYTVTLRKLQKALAKGNEMLPDDEDSDAERCQEPSDARNALSKSAGGNKVHKRAGDGQSKQQGSGSKPPAPETEHDEDGDASENEEFAAEQAHDGMLSARRWLSKKLRVKPRQAKRLQTRYESHDAKDMQVLDLQLSAFCYDKVRRKRVCDDLMKNVRHHLLNFLEEDPSGEIRAALDSLPHDKVHQRLIAQSVEEKNRREELEAKLTQYTELLRRIDDAGGTIAAASETQSWQKWRDRRRKLSDTNSVLKRPRFSK